MTWGQIAQSRLDQIAHCSLASPGVSRFPFTDEHRAALGQIGAWMQAAGLSAQMDAAGTLVGRKPGHGPALLLGSHQDSVRDAGRYDGIMGIALACLALEKLRRDGVDLPYPVEVLAFADEEGVRFPTALLGPRALAGTVPQGALDGLDEDGLSVADALRRFGGAPEQLQTLRRAPEEVRGYLELHIEQGPVLELADLGLGVVTGICGIERNSVTFTGETGHAGTVPMSERADALVAAADFISQIHDSARGDLRATIGTLRLHPDVVNGIPDHVTVSLEARDIDDATRAGFVAEADALGQSIATRRGCGFAMRQTYVQPAVPCDPGLMRTLSVAVERQQGKVKALPSGATHDASAMADLCPVGMLFLRCRGGVSHRPDEYASAEDMGLAVDALADVLRALS